MPRVDLSAADSTCIPATPVKSRQGASGNPNPLTLAGAPSPGSRLVPGPRAAPGDTPLTAAAVLEEFERARRYVARHGEADMAPEQLELLQVQCGACKC